LSKVLNVTQTKRNSTKTAYCECEHLAFVPIHTQVISWLSPNAIWPVTSRHVTSRHDTLEINNMKQRVYCLSYYLK